MENALVVPGFPIAGLVAFVLTRLPTGPIEGPQPEMLLLWYWRVSLEEARHALWSKAKRVGSHSKPPE